jgi:hypothetical protein
VTRVFDYEAPTEATLAATYSVTLDLKRTGYQQLLPSFACPPALLQHFGSEDEVAAMLDHIKETYLSTRYRETRDWLGFLRQEATAKAIRGWVAELSAMDRLHMPAHLGQITNGSGYVALQELLSDRPQDGQGRSDENLAKQIVGSLLAAGLEAFPDFIESLGLPNTVEKLEQMTPYELALAVFSRWHTEEALSVELARTVQSIPGQAMQALVQFCVRAILYRFNVHIRPDYRPLFVAMPQQSDRVGAAIQVGEFA